MRASDNPQAQFLWAIFRDVFHYLAYHLAGIADNARDVDLAMRWGFGWTQGPFETWQAAEWAAIAEALVEDIAAGRAMSRAPLPAWVRARAGQGGVHAAGASYSARRDEFVARPALPVYQRPIFPDRVLGEPAATGHALWENDGVRLWILPQVDAGIAIVSVKSRNHTFGCDAIVGMQEAVARAEADYRAMVI